MMIKFYITASGRSPVEEFIEGQSKEVGEDFLAAKTRLANGENLEMPRSKNLSSIFKGLHELRIKDAAGQYRIFYYVKRGDAIYMLHAFKKKTRDLPQREIETAIKRIKEI